MTKKNAQLLIIEDDEIDQLTIIRHFNSEKLPYDITTSKTVKDSLKKLKEDAYDVLLIDYNLPDGNGLEIQKAALGIPCVYLSGVTDTKLAVEVMRAGASNFLIKDTERNYLHLLELSLSKAITQKQAENELVRYRTQLEAEVLLRTSELQEINSELINENKIRLAAEEKAKRHLKFITALHDIDAVITSSIDLNLTLNILLRHTTSTLEVDAAAFFMLDNDLLLLSYKAGIGFKSNDKLQNAEVKLGDSYGGKVALENKLLITDFDVEIIDDEFSDFIKEEQFVSYAGAPLVAKGKIIGVLEVYKRSHLNHNSEWVKYFEALANQAAIGIDNFSLFYELQQSNFELSLGYDQTIAGWAKTLEMRDHETEGHSQWVTDMTVKLARQMGINSDALVHLHRGALLHDIGKMNIPDKILHKPSNFNEEEWEIMKKHTEYAYNFLSQIKFLEPALDIPRYHHERWDGKGYNHGLTGEQIPLPARIFAIVDVYDALSSDRPYRKAWSMKKTIAHIKEQSGKHFDPAVVDAFLSLLKNN